MNSFGLGLVLNFVDNASAGMGKAAQTFREMSSTADSLSASVNGSVSSIVAASYALSSVGGTLSDTGNAILNVFTGLGNVVTGVGSDFENTRMTLKALYKDADVAESKVRWLLDFAATTPFEIPSLKAAMVGLKAIGIEADQTVTSVGGVTQTLMGFVGDLAALRPDVPMERIVYAIRNALGGNVRSLAMTLDVDVNSILGRKFGASGDAAQDIADLVSNLGAEGLMKDLEGTWSQMLSNLPDQWTRFVLKMSDAGLFNTFKHTLSTFYKSVVGITDEQMSSLATVVTKGFQSLWEPVDKLVTKLSSLIPVFIEWAEAHPEAIENIMKLSAGLGAFLVVGGTALKILGALGFAFAGFRELRGFPRLLSAITKNLGLMFIKALPLVGLATVFYMAWKTNLFGIRDLLTEAYTDISTIISLLADAWDGELSPENFKKANEMGLLPLIESFIQLKYYLGFLGTGIKEGFESFFQNFAELFDWLNIAGIDISDLASKVGEFLKGLVDVGAEDKWEFIGKIAGHVLGFLTILLAVIPIVHGIFRAFGLVSKAVGGVIGVGKILWGVITTIATVLGVSSGWVAIVVAGVLGLATLIITKWDDIKAVWKGIPNWWDTNVKDPFVESCWGIWEDIKAIGERISNFFGGIAEKITSVGSWRPGVSPGTPYIPPAAARGVDNFVGGLIQVNEQGGELINLPSGSTVVPHDQSIRDSLKRGVEIGATSFAKYAKNGVSNRPSVTETNDYSVTFSAGSIVFQLNRASDEELEKAAEKLMKIIERKQRLKKMAVRSKKTEEVFA